MLLHAYRCLLCVQLPDVEITDCTGAPFSPAWRVSGWDWIHVGCGAAGHSGLLFQRVSTEQLISRAGVFLESGGWGVNSAKHAP